MSLVIPQRFPFEKCEKCKRKVRNFHCHIPQSCSPHHFLMPCWMLLANLWALLAFILFCSVSDRIWVSVSLRAFWDFPQFSFHSTSVSGCTQSPQINLKNLRNIWNAKCPNPNVIQPFLAVQQCPSTHRCFEISRVVKSRSKNFWAAARQSSRPSIWLIRGKLSPIRLRSKSDLISDYEYVNIRNIKMKAP